MATNPTRIAGRLTNAERFIVGNISAGKDAKNAGGLVMEATANTFRYLDKNEKAANAQKEANAKKGAQS